MISEGYEPARNWRRTFVITCDGCDTATEPRGTVSIAVSIAKGLGWRAVAIDGRVRDLCPGCQREANPEARARAWEPMREIPTKDRGRR